MRRRVLFAASFIALSISAVSAENWPQWRGPLLNGVSDEKNLPVHWGPDENVTWKSALPEWSGSTPIIWDNYIFLNVAEKDSLSLWALNRADGAVRWKKPLGAGNVKMRKQNMSSPSPVTDGKSVWVMTGTGILKCFDFAGNEIWGRDIQKEYGKFGLNWGYASSPLLYDNSLFVPVLHGMRTDEPSYILRIDARTGKTTWRAERPTQAIRESPDAYITPGLLKQGSRAELIISGGDCVTGHDISNGAELWRAYGLNPENDPNYRIVNSPLISDGMIYVGSKYKPYLAVRAGGSGDVTKSHVAWTFANGPDVPTPVIEGDRLYIVRDNGVVFCLDKKTGQEIYSQQRLKTGTYSSSPVLADGKVYITNEEGLTTVFKTGPTFEILAENALNDYCLSSPAISDGQIFIRTAQTLYCIGKRTSATKK
jgi:outer membrane protein assembly factor BamB